MILVKHEVVVLLVDAVVGQVLELVVLVHVVLCLVLAVLAVVPQWLNG